MVPIKAVKRKSSVGSVWAVAGLGVVAVGLLIGASIWSSNQREARTPINRPPELKSDAELKANGTTLGDPNAKAELVEYADFLCPGCGAAFKLLEPQYADLIDSGQMKFTVKDYVLDGHRPYAQWAAEAAYCAADQGQFWAYRAILFSNQKQWTKNDLKRYARELNLDTGKFGQCLDSGTHTERVNRSTQEAIDQKLRGTPTYLINGVDLDLAELQTVDAFMARLKAEVARANGQ